MAEQAPDGILSAMQRTINEAQERMGEYQLDRMKAYFTPEGEPLTERFVLAGGKTLEVPRYSLVPQTCLAIDKGADAGLITVSIKFKSIPIPEGAVRVLDSLNLDIVEKAAET
jgi:hypothetical protein